MISIYYCCQLDRIVLLSLSGDDIIWDYGEDRCYRLSRSQSIIGLTMPMFTYHLIGVFNEN